LSVDDANFNIWKTLFKRVNKLQTFHAVT